jgi:hypothetical protein
LRNRQPIPAVGGVARQRLLVVSTAEMLDGSAPIGLVEDAFAETGIVLTISKSVIGQSIWDHTIWVYSHERIAVCIS